MRRAGLPRPPAEPAEAAAEIHDAQSVHVGKQRPERRPFGRAVEPFDRAAEPAVAFEELFVVVDVLGHSTVAAQDAAGHGPGVLAGVVELDAGHERRLDPFGLRHQAPSVAGQVVGVLRRLRGHRVGIEQHEVGHLALGQHAAVGDAEHPRRHLGELVHGLLQTEHLALADPEVEQRGGVAHVADEIDVRPAVGEADQAAVVGDEPLDPGRIEVERGRLKARVEIVGDAEIEVGVDGTLALAGGDLLQRAPHVAGELRLADLQHPHLAPHVAALAAVELLAERLAERGIPVERDLLGRGAVERLLPRDERAEHGGILEIALAHDRPRRDLRNGLPYQVAEPREGLIVEVGLAGMGEQRQPRDRPAAGAGDLAQQLDVLVAHRVHAAGVQDHLDGAPADVVQAAHHADQLLAAGVAAGQRPPLVADVIARGGGGEAEGARLHRLAQQAAHGGDLVLGGGALERGLAHHVVTQRGEGHQPRHVDAEAAAVDGVEVLAVALPLPVDARLHDVVGNGLDVDEVLHQDLARRRLHRRHAHAAVAHDDGGHAVPRRAGDHRIPRDLRVVVRVRIDEAWCQHQAARVEHALGGQAVAPADRADETVLDAEVAHEAGAAGSVDDPRVLDQQIEHRGPLSISFNSLATPVTPGGGRRGGRGRARMARLSP